MMRNQVTHILKGNKRTEIIQQHLNEKEKQIRRERETQRKIAAESVCRNGGQEEDRRIDTINCKLSHIFGICLDSAGIDNVL